MALVAAAQRLTCTGQPATFLVPALDKSVASSPGDYTLLLTGRGQFAQALLRSAKAVKRVA